MGSLLAVDVGVKTGLSLFGSDGRLVWYRSHNLGAASRLRRAVPRVFDEAPDLSRLVLEGGGPVADLWAREAARRGIVLRKIPAETWRELLLYPREQRTGAQAKQSAAARARRVIDWSGAPKPTALRHDAAEAILVGLWGVIDAGWLERVPEELRR